jgi:tetraacyldisaccharide 4'-kinase
MMLHWLLPDIPIVIHQDRREGAKAAVREYGSPALIMDDGFQYRALRKDLEIVLVDGEKPLGNGYLLPAGSLREPASALRRADILVGVGSATTEMEAARRLAGEYDRAFCEAFVRSGKPVKFPKDNSSTAPKKVVLVSGIARHERFYRAAVEAGFQPCEHCHFRDHHPFSQKDMIHVQDIVRRVGAEAILTTAKDAVRLADLRVELPIWILPVEFCWKKPEEIASLIEKMLFAGGSDDPPRQG